MMGGIRISSRLALKWRAITVAVVVLVLAASGIIFVHFRYVSSGKIGQDNTVSETVCSAFDVRQVERASGKSVIFENFGRSSSSEYVPDLSCQLSLDGFGDVKIGYINARWFRDGPSSHVSESELLDLEKSHGWAIEKMDLGLDGNSYLAVSPKRESVVAYGAWYSSSGRTFSVAVYNLSDTSITDEQIKEVIDPLMRYLVSAVQAKFPVT
ncbi:hypothetical protein [Actinomyces sp. ZJ308]|uniref:hypothetical protein n=1 Tax=Actinomyces sp. ZJ308 TaxID=2708342 RepID=UPI001420E818|nr:hypothetical protein [Actinomyces sp. ZJ308]